MPKLKNISAGTLAQATGNAAQIDFEASLRQYETLGLAKGQRNYPEITQRGFVARVIGKASPDYTAFVAGGTAIQFEVKTWQSKDTHTYSFDGKSGRQRREQYQMMCDFARFVPTVYLVLWRWGQNAREWRIYPVLLIPQLDNGLLFERAKGQVIKETVDGWPDWLETTKRTYE